MLTPEYQKAVTYTCFICHLQPVGFLVFMCKSILFKSKNHQKTAKLRPSLQKGKVSPLCELEKIDQGYPCQNSSKLFCYSNLMYMYNIP